jgi:hypothetical protein
MDSGPPTALARLRSLLRALATAVLVPVLLFEEWGWEPLAALVAKLARLRIWERAEKWVRDLPPWGALLAFLLPVLLLLPFKVLAVFLFSEGHAASGVAVLLAAKLVGTAIVARIFQLAEPALMRIRLFARWYPRWKGWKDNVLSEVRASSPWRSFRVVKLRLRRWWRQLRRS